MQNIPGLSFFDGLTRSRALQSRTSSNSASSPPETPLQDATPFRNGKGADIDTDTDTVSHPLGKDGDRVQDESSDTFDDPLSLATSNSNSSASTLPAASFSRRAATISSGSSSPMPGLPGRRATSSSTMGRSSILSLDNIFSAPILSRRASSITESATASGRARSASTASKENEEPTAKDVSLMAQGTQAYAMLKRIQEHPIELADIIRLLVTKKAILILPTCPISKDESGPTRATYEDHVIIPESTQGESLFVTLSGIRGVLKPASSSVAILGMATGQDFGTIASDASGLTKRSFFDNVSKSEGPEGSGAVDGSKELKLVNSSKRPVVIFVDSVGSIHTLLVDSVIPSPEGDAVPTPIVPLAIGIATVKDRSAAMRTPSAASSVRSMNISDDKDGTPLPKLPRIASDLPLEWDSTVKDLERYIS
ncbi:hypothetical protein BC939DRAFT_271542 [Gamsiella multidivaricata]|uniref:uncharacterized protein n=1 Tax=Gamsiella multidivaricata TaxID=101098 RepID=UPI002220A68F|nr:uncharacterized protein BC939DRAFT_271542 [Gamsiella multidivaricata]KAI7819073.1 hypothetical protein BC939DRAFT_271542 [Gamsiella multidivaricata]